MSTGVTIKERYAATRLLFSSYYSKLTSEIINSLLDEMYDEGLDADREVVMTLINLVLENEDFLTKKINEKIKSKTLDYFALIPCIILKLATAEITLNNSKKNICIADYLSISKALGIDRANIGFINSLLDQINVVS